MEHQVIETVYSLHNPWWQQIARRLQAAGGKHAASTVATDRKNRAEQIAVDMARETAELRQHFEVPF